MLNRRTVLLGGTAALAASTMPASAQSPAEIRIGFTYPLSGNAAQIGVDAQKALETAADVINNNYDFDLPLAKGEGLPGLGGAKLRLIFSPITNPTHKRVARRLRRAASSPRKTFARSSEPTRAPLRSR